MPTINRRRRDAESEVGTEEPVAPPPPVGTPEPPAVVPFYPSERLVGLELEYDAGGTELRLPPRIPHGWSKKGDGSLRNGFEMVLEPPLRLPDSIPVCRTFCQAFNEARTNTCKSGGFHVHVQAADYTNHDSFQLVRLYSHFQPVINTLLGKSRHNNSFCPPYRNGTSQRDVEAMFNLNSPATSRSDAKCTRAYSVINLAMMRCRDPQHRTVEFRQGSTTKRFECVVGWTTLVVALVDIAKDEQAVNSAVSGRCSMDKFLLMLSQHEQRVGATGLKDWVVWRHHYMNAIPTDAQVSEAVSMMSSQPRGIFYVSRAMNVNLAMAQRILERAVQLRLVTRAGSSGRYGDGGASKYQASYGAWSTADLTALEAAAMARARGENSESAEPPPVAEDDERILQHEEQ